MDLSSSYLEHGSKPSLNRTPRLLSCNIPIVIHVFICICYTRLRLPSTAAAHAGSVLHLNDAQALKNAVASALVGHVTMGRANGFDESREQRSEPGARWTPSSYSAWSEGLHRRILCAIICYKRFGGKNSRIFLWRKSRRVLQ